MCVALQRIFTCLNHIHVFVFIALTDLKMRNLINVSHKIREVIFLKEKKTTQRTIRSKYFGQEHGRRIEDTTKPCKTNWFISIEIQDTSYQ